ncbi:hypothetical protein DB32_006084 [Sandaracinus amylolyticus]|uniref:Uncharacterized protein n=1 Tax=Sandaracinus amylolyticus TaxID=927083 RepID=A0A0F6YKY9_9BACT|nr:hypothetical protein DB32_006084 [Sandaracinus amylolyticus]
MRPPMASGIRVRGRRSIGTCANGSERRWGPARSVRGAGSAGRVEGSSKTPPEAQRGTTPW